MTRSTLENQSLVLEACSFLSVKDARLKILIETFGLPDFHPGGDPYQALVRSIISQQISWKAARAIRARFLAIFPDTDFPEPRVLADTNLQELRLAGLSLRKAEYVKGIGNAFSDPGFLGTNMHELQDVEVSAKLMSIRGVGQWTADMFMIFTLGRPDVLPLNDQGIINGLKVFFDLDHHPDPKKMVMLTQHWKPFRSIASWYMWKVVDEDFNWDSQ